MPILKYDGPRRFSRPNSARTFPEAYYSERDATLDCPRTEPYAYQMGGPVSGLRNRPSASREEFPPEQGGSRRRIAVAVSCYILSPKSHPDTTADLLVLLKRKF